MKFTKKIPKDFGQINGRHYGFSPKFTVRALEGILGYPNISGFTLWISPKKVQKKLFVNEGYPSLFFWKNKRHLGGPKCLLLIELFQRVEESKSKRHEPNKN